MTDDAYPSPSEEPKMPEEGDTIRIAKEGEPDRWYRVLKATPMGYGRVSVEVEPDERDA